MQYLRTGRIITLFLASILLSLSFAVGKNNFFLLLNNNLGTAADFFFKYFSYAGDGLMWIPALAIVLFLLKRGREWLILLSAFITTTIFTQVCKYLIVPNEPRPVKAITQTALIHTVPGVELHSISSFPSGHAATAFTLYLVFCYFINRRWWLYMGLVYALLVSYSRIYLAQHFPLDVAAGMIVGAISATVALQIQRWHSLNKAKKNLTK